MYFLVMLLVHGMSYLTLTLKYDCVYIVQAAYSGWLYIEIPYPIINHWYSVPPYLSI